MKKTAIITILAIAILMFVIAPFAQAAEINPDPGSYSFGSTSEFSPYASGTPPGPGPLPGPDGTAQSTAQSLAPTGQNAWILYLLAIVAIATPLAYFGVKNTRR